VNALNGRLCFAILAAAASGAAATPDIDSAILHTRVFNDFPGSTLTTTNLYPSLIQFNDGPVGGPSGFANRHNFRLSDTGFSDAVFLNIDAFVFEADVTLLGTAPVRGGLEIAPHFSQLLGGGFDISLPSGEVAASGGRLPAFSFTTAFGLHYQVGTTIHQKVIYRPNGVSQASPGTMEYIYTDASGVYSSGPLAFSEGDPIAGLVFGNWGILHDARVGGYVQIENAGPEHSAGIRFENMQFAVPSPGSLSLLGLAGVAAIRRRGHRQ
jgi:hypothetical protein